MDILYAIVVVSVVGLSTWLLVTYIPMPEPFQHVISAISLAGSLVWLMMYFGLFKRSVTILLPMLAFVIVSGCVPAHTHWTRADVVKNPAQQQVALEKDREACGVETARRPLLHQALLGDFELTLCLERRGWKRVP